MDDFMKEKSERVQAELEKNRLQDESYVPSAFHQNQYGFYGPWSLN